MKKTSILNPLLIILTLLSCAQAFADADDRKDFYSKWDARTTRPQAVCQDAENTTIIIKVAKQGYSETYLAEYPTSTGNRLFTFTGLDTAKGEFMTEEIFQDDRENLRGLTNQIQTPTNFKLQIQLGDEKLEWICD